MSNPAPLDLADSLLANEPVLRFGIFAAVLLVMASWEVLAPRRRQALGRVARWPSNLAIVALDGILLRLLFPMGAVALALLAETKGWGLLNIWQLPSWLDLLLAIVILDFAIYLQHVLFHAVPALWRLHRMHHADVEVDVTTGARFHPIEIILSMVIKLAVVAALGAPALAVLIFEVLLNATAMFNHSNVRLPTAVDRVLRCLVVTPDMHRVHHSVIPEETNANFGFNLPWWDRVFGTYRDQPRGGHLAMTLGLAQFRQPLEQRLDRLLIQPFRKGDDSTTIAKRQRVIPNLDDKDP